MKFPAVGHFIDDSGDTTIGSLLVDAEIFVDGDWIESKDQDPNGDVRLIQLADIGDGCYLDKSSRFLTSKTAQTLRCTFLEPGDVLVARMPDPLGRACIFPGDLKKAITVVDVCVIRPNRQRLGSAWLVHAINSPIIRQRISEYVTGTTRQRISRGNLSKIKLSAPPLPEQRRIAAILDKADALCAKRRKTVVKLDQLLKSVFLDMFGDPVTNPKGWPIVSLSTYGSVATGNTPSRSVLENYGSGIEWIKSDNLNTASNYVTLANEQLSPAGERAARTVSAGSVLVTCIAGSLSCIGNLAIADRRVAFNQQINAITPYSAPPEFLYFLLKTSKRLIQSASTNGMKGIVNKSKFSRIQLPAPPIELQKEFSRIFLKVHKHRLLANAALEKQDALFAGLQQRAFKGLL